MLCRAIPYEGKEPYLFVSYCHADQEKLYPLFEQMASEGCRLWYDEGNRPGEDWVENIEDHLEQSNACLAFISSSSSLSHNCKREIIFALKCRKKVIPVLIEDAELPKGLRLQLADMHYLKRWDFPSDRELLKKLYETKEIKDCTSDSSAGLLRSASEQIPSAKEETPAQKPDGGILSQLFSGSLKPSNPDIKLKKPEPVTEKKDDPQKENGHNPVSVHKVKVREIVAVSKRKEKKPEEKVEIHTAPETDSKPQPECFPQNDSDPDQDEGTILQKCPEVPDDEGTVLVSDFDDEKTIQAPRFSPALLLCPGKDRAFILSKPQITLGRSPIKCDVIIEGNESISKHHADIIMLNGKYYLSDAGSTNGTYLNGERLEPGKQMQLENPAMFKLNDERLIFFSGPSLNRLVHQESIGLLMNETETAVRIIDEARVPLNRSHRWPDGTLADLEIHRNAHAAVCLDPSGYSLKDENSINGTYLNGIRLNQGASSSLSSGDQITLGKTTLRFYSISLKGDKQ